MGEDKEAHYISVSLDFSEFDLLVEEENPGASKDKDEIDEVDRSEKFWDYLTLYHPQMVPRPSRVRVESSYATENVESVVTEAKLFIWRALFQVPNNVHFWIPEKDDHDDQLLEEYIAMNFDTMMTGVRFSLHPVISDLLNFLNLALTQITPNGWSI